MSGTSSSTKQATSGGAPRSRASARQGGAEPQLQGPAGAKAGGGEEEGEAEYGLGEHPGFVRFVTDEHRRALVEPMRSRRGEAVSPEALSARAQALLQTCSGMQEWVAENEAGAGRRMSADGDVERVGALADRVFDAGLVMLDPTGAGRVVRALLGISRAGEGKFGFAGRWACRHAIFIMQKLNELREHERWGPEVHAAMIAEGLRTTFASALAHAMARRELGSGSRMRPPLAKMRGEKGTAPPTPAAAAPLSAPSCGGATTTRYGASRGYLRSSQERTKWRIA